MVTFGSILEVDSMAGSAGPGDQEFLVNLEVQMILEDYLFQVGLVDLVGHWSITTILDKGTSIG